MRLWVGFLSVVCVAAPGWAAPLVLVKDGKPVSRIVIPSQAIESQRRAAEELQYHIEKMSGARLEVASADQAPRDAREALILVGQSPLVAELGVETGKLDYETVVIRTVGNRLILAGEDGLALRFAGGKVMDGAEGRDRRNGTLHAVYGFLQDQLGCRWIWPGESGEVIPLRKTIEVGEMDVQETPRIRRRSLRPLWTKSQMEALQRTGVGKTFDLGKPLDKLIREESVWLQRMRMGGSFRFYAGHNFGSWWATMGNTRPEIFALQEDGTRGVANGKGSPRTVKMCVANPKLWDLQIERFRESLKAAPFMKSLNCCENDGGRGFCRCELCKAWDAGAEAAQAASAKTAAPDGSDIDARRGQGDDDGLPASLSNRYCRWYNELARRAREVDSEAFVTAYAYSRYRSAPVGVRLEPNVLVGYVGFSFYPIPPERREAERADFMAWRAAGARLFLRPNSLYFTGHAVPFDVTRQIASDFQFCAKDGVESTDFDALLGSWGMCGPMCYVLARLHWNTGQTIEKLVDEYYEGFGPMGRVAREYFDYWERFTAEKWSAPGVAERVKELSPTSGARGRVLVGPEIYTPEALAAGQAILDKSKETLGKASPEERTRFENLEMGLKHSALTMDVLRGATKLSNYMNADIEGFCANQRKLMETRRRMLGRGVDNVYWLTYHEANLGNLLRLDMLSDLGERAGITRMNLDNWLFRFDPENAGEAQGWSRGPFENKAEAGAWSRTRVDQTWEGAPPGVAWRKAQGRDFDGVAWYAVQFATPRGERVEDLALLLPRVKGAALVWINGEAVRMEKAPESEAWEGRLPAGTRAGATLALVVKVTSKGEPGGVTRPAYVFRKAAAQ